MRPSSLIPAVVVLLGSANPARAQGSTDAGEEPAFTPGGYVEAYYQWNFNVPSNGLTNFRGFDNRHNSFTLSNVALEAHWDHEDVLGRIALQFGSTPSTYYLAEPALAGSSSVNATGTELWKFLQQAQAGYRFGIGRGLLVEAGLFLSPIGPEAVAVHDNWNWSRSNLYFGLPFYQTGVRATLPLTERWSVAFGGYNGWNSVVDNNEEKSLAAQVTYTCADLALSFLYFGGVERPQGAPEGRAWRNLFDAHATWTVSPRVSLMAHVDAGFEFNRLGVNSWLAGAAYARLTVIRKLFLAVRVDAFGEREEAITLVAPGSLFWPVSWVTSGTATVDYRPADKVSLRLEYRHDRAAGDMFFGDTVAGDGLATPFVPNRSAQDTLTLGATSWF